MIVNAKPSGILSLGRTGENQARSIRFDISHWVMDFGPGVVELVHQRSGDPYPYPVVVSQDGNYVTWNITATDTAVVGLGRCELRYYVGETLAKSETWMTKVFPALGPAAETPPDPYQSWVDQVLQAGAEAKEAAEKAENAAVRQPVVGDNGNWWTWDPDTGAYADAGIYSGGDAPYIGTNGNWYVGQTDTGVAATGPAGPVGPEGPEGPVGPVGPEGPEGPAGTTGPAGPHGPQGEPGPQGPEGPTGPTGATGPQGPKGDKGDQGEKGDTGAQGPKGDKGDTGERGPIGETGAQGPAGPALAVTNAATVGQTIRVSAVDESGQPTEWEAVDMASGGGEGSQKMELLFEVQTTEEASTILSGVNPAEYDEITMMCQTVAADGTTTTHLDWIFGERTARLSGSLHATQRRLHVFHAVKNADSVWIGQISRGFLNYDLGAMALTHVSEEDAVTVFYGGIKTDIGCQAYIPSGVNLAIGTILKVYGRKS